MGKIEVILPPEVEKKRLLSVLPGFTDEVLNVVHLLRSELDSIREDMSPELKSMYDSIPLKGLEETLEDIKVDYTEETPLDILRDHYNFLQEFSSRIKEVFLDKDKNYRIVTDPKTGERRVLEFKSQIPEGVQTPSSLSSFAMGEIEKIRKRPKPERVPVPKDLMETQIHSVGDTLEYITDPETIKQIKEYQSKGKLLAGTLEGLSGGDAYLKSFTIALAQTLNEQSKYYQTEGDLSGVKGLIEEKFGEEVQIIKDSNVPLKGGGTEKRPHPYILVSYEDLASKMRGKGKKRGGKDAVQIRDYIESLSGKQYLLDGGTDSRGRRILSGVPFLIRLQYFYIDGKEVGCLLCLSPQFSKTLRKYTSVRADTIQLIGGGRQKDITMSLLDLLLYVRGTDRGNLWEKNKKDLLSQIATSTIYKGRPKRREEDFREALQKVKDSGLIIDYWEKSSSWGDVISVFKFNPHYSKREETESPDVQTGEE